MNVEMICRNVVFHFNKKHLEDQTVPMWVVKTSGKSFYVEHVSCDIPWSTKETKDNPHTKGSIKVDKVLLTIDDDNHAKMTSPTINDIVRLKAEKIKNYARIVIHGLPKKMLEFFNENSIEYTKLKTVYGTCGSQFHICDIAKKEDVALMALSVPHMYRVLQPNEIYYKAYDNEEIFKTLTVNEYYIALQDNTDVPSGWTNGYDEYDDDDYDEEENDDDDE